MKNKKKILIAIMILAAFLRLWKLGSYPAFNADEAAIGYNAYSLLETGKDEHGNPWPIHFQSFNDYKPGLYFYIVLPFVKLMGLNEWGVRLPAALMGVTTVYLIYLLVLELFKNKKLALVSGFLLAISPWHIHFSRGGWEVNVGTFFLVAGILFFYKALKSPKLFTLSFSLFVASLYTYHATRVVIPLLGLGLLIIYRKNLIKEWKRLLVAFAISGILLVPLVIDLTRGNVMSRAAGVGLFADAGPFSRTNEQRGEHEDYTGLFPKLTHNKGVNYGLAFMGNWAEHFNGEFLFLSGDEIERNKVPETGQMYIYEIITVLVGLFAILRSKKKKSWTFVLLWLVVAPAASALTFQSPHALRAHNMVLPLVILSAYGLTLVGGFMTKRKLMIGIYFIIGLVAWQFSRYLHMYYVHMAKEYKFSSQYGVRELITYTEAEKEKYEEIVITDRYDQPYILTLFYSKYSPEVFQGEHELTARDGFGFSTVRSFGKYNFTSIQDWVTTRRIYPNSLIAGTDEEIPEEANILKDIYGSNDHRYFRAVAN